MYVNETLKKAQDGFLLFYILQSTHQKEMLKQISFNSDNIETGGHVDHHAGHIQN